MTEPLRRRRKSHGSRPFTLVVAIAVLALVLPGISAATRLQPAKPALPVMAADTVGVCSDGSTPSASGATAQTRATLPDFQAIVSPADPGVRTISYDGVKLRIKPSAVRLPVIPRGKLE